VPGSDFSGVIVDGHRDGFEIGDEVIGMVTMTQGVFAGRGALAEYVAVPDSTPLARKPSRMSFAQAAGLPLVALTVNTIFRRSGLGKGDRVFVNGASGGVGQFAVQFARAKGCYVVATCSQRTKAFVESLGADEVVDYRASDLKRYMPTAYPGDSPQAFDGIIDVRPALHARW
jgi:NADPH:quinone reductase-like Zn-dependent oxidoreductase